MLTSEILDTIDAALYFLRASGRTEMHGDQLERIDAALEWLAAVKAERGQGVGVTPRRLSRNTERSMGNE